MVMVRGMARNRVRTRVRDRVKILFRVKGRSFKGFPGFGLVLGLGIW
jgi:hypothetical protein